MVSSSPTLSLRGVAVLTVIYVLSCSAFNYLVSLLLHFSEQWSLTYNGSVYTTKMAISASETLFYLQMPGLVITSLCFTILVGPSQLRSNIRIRAVLTILSAIVGVAIVITMVITPIGGVPGLVGKRLVVFLTYTLPDDPAFNALVLLTFDCWLCLGLSAIIERVAAYREKRSNA